MGPKTLPLSPAPAQPHWQPLAQNLPAWEHFPEARENKTCVTERSPGRAACTWRLGLCSLAGLPPHPYPSPTVGLGIGHNPPSFSGYFKIPGQGHRNSGFQGAIIPRKDWLPKKMTGHSLSISLSLPLPPFPSLPPPSLFLFPLSPPFLNQTSPVGLKPW